MEETKAFEFDVLEYQTDLRAKSFPRRKGHVSFSRANETDITGFYHEYDEFNPRLIHVKVISFSKDKYPNLLRYCRNGNMMRDVLKIDESKKNASRLRGELALKYLGRLYHVSREAWNDRIREWLQDDNGTTVPGRENVAGSPEAGYSVNISSRDTRDRRYASYNGQRELADEYPPGYTRDRDRVRTICSLSERYTGVHVWRHLKPNGRSWDFNVTHSVGDADLTRAITDVHWAHPLRRTATEE